MAKHLSFATLIVTLSALTGCGGADVNGARWRDERTVVLPADMIDFGQRTARREQVAAEHNCPPPEVVLLAAIETGSLEITPVRACGAALYYATLDGEFRDITRRIGTSATFDDRGSATLELSATAADPPLGAEAPLSDE